MYMQKPDVYYLYHIKYDDRVIEDYIGSKYGTVIEIIDTLEDKKHIISIVQEGTVKITVTKQNPGE
jgi:hypothetical protein